MWIFAQAKYGKRKKENEKIKELNTPKKNSKHQDQLFSIQNNKWIVTR